MRDDVGMILHTNLPDDMTELRALPGIQPVQGDWLRVDEAYAGQMARREALLSTQRDDVLWHKSHALGPARELLEHVRANLPAFSFDNTGDNITCPDGRKVEVSQNDPIGTLGRLVQCDLCFLEKVGDEHVLQGAVLCFPASWSLHEKAGRPLIGIHARVAEYDDTLARRVQRLFDGVQVGRPLWRFNRLNYVDAELYQPRTVADPRLHTAEDAPFIRAERQTVLRLPKSRWVVFAIHTYVVRRLP